MQPLWIEHQLSSAKEDEYLLRKINQHSSARNSKCIGGIVKRTVSTTEARAGLKLNDATPDFERVWWKGLMLTVSFFVRAKIKSLYHANNRTMLLNS